VHFLSLLFLSMGPWTGPRLNAMRHNKSYRRRNLHRNTPAARDGNGFSLIEALIALTITSMAGAVLLLGVQSSLDTTIEAVERTIADRR